MLTPSLPLPEVVWFSFRVRSLIDEISGAVTCSLQGVTVFSVTGDLRNPSTAFDRMSLH